MDSLKSTCFATQHRPVYRRVATYLVHGFKASLWYTTGLFARKAQLDGYLRAVRSVGGLCRAGVRRLVMVFVRSWNEQRPVFNVYATQVGSEQAILLAVAGSEESLERELDRLLREAEARWHLDPLQLRVLEQVVLGATNQETGTALRITEADVARALTAIYRQARVGRASRNQRVTLVLRFWGCPQAE